MTESVNRNRGWNRRDVLKASLGVGAGMMFGPSLLSNLFADGPTGSKPNIVMIFVDDMGYGDTSLSPFVNTDPNRKVNTPNLARMASEGRKFTSAYVAGSVCTPSRCGLMTGRQPFRVNADVADNVLWETSTWGMPASEITMAEMLKTQGYDTACVGKWHLGLGTQGISGLATHHEYAPISQGFDTWFGTPGSNDNNTNQPTTALIRDTTILEDDTELKWLTRRYTTESIKFMRQAAQKGNPFFLYLAPNMPHTELAASRQFLGSSGSTDASLFYDVVQELDWSVGKIMDELKRMGIDENTLVLFTSDNGPWLKENANPDPLHEAGHPGPFREGKGTTFEGGYREPFVAWWPGTVPADTTDDRPLTTMDLFPTLAGLAGATLPTDRILDGKDITGMLTGEGHRDDGGTFEFYYYRCRKWYWNRNAASQIGYAAYRKCVYDQSAANGWDNREDWKMKLALNDIVAEIPINHPDYLFDFTTTDGQRELDSANVKAANLTRWNTMKSELNTFRNSLGLASV